MSASIRVGVEYGVMRGAQVVRVVHVVSQKENGDFLSEPRGTWSPSGRARSGSGAHLVEITSDVLRELEWSGVGQGSAHGCPVCGAASPIYRDGGRHAPDCRLAALLKGGAA